MTINSHKNPTVGLFFGSFNPVHNGHIQLAVHILAQQLVDEIWFVVSPCNPLKINKELIDEYQRLDMLIMAIKDNPRIKVSDIEFTMPVPSYTSDTLKKLVAEYPDFQFNLLIGSDNALVFNQWKDYHDILSLFPVWVYPRKGYDFDLVSQLYPEMHLLNTPVFDISSTQIREAIFKKKDVSAWIHPLVYNYIAENDLYK